ncbi:hypothetical protein RF007C_15675 [Ruminococcus flavefaciens 007c]|uniref:Uncharacterized protein n=1 Tax=Ruminococcus flavefaciens 007c TaxID=1341157 RepID=W7UN90_RUMFL|nr:hypothetical protein RF007C_15675 [Ruminococcus flavefaciens 007c]
MKKITKGYTADISVCYNIAIREKELLPYE